MSTAGTAVGTGAVRQFNAVTVAQYLASESGLASGKRKAVLLRAAPVWDGPPELSFGERRAGVAAAVSPLAVYELVLAHFAPDARISEVHGTQEAGTQDATASTVNRYASRRLEVDNGRARAYPDWFNGPAPSFGDPAARHQRHPPLAQELRGLGVELLRPAQLLQRGVRVALRQDGAGQPVVGVGEAGIELDRAPELAGGLVEAPGVVERGAALGADDQRERVGAVRHVQLGQRFLDAVQ